MLSKDGAGEDEIVFALVLFKHVERRAAVGQGTGQHPSFIRLSPRRRYSRVQHVRMDNGRALRDLVDADILIGLEQQIDDDLSPVGTIREQA